MTDSSTWPSWSADAARTRVLMISLALPEGNPRHAGGAYVRTLLDELERDCEVIVLAPDGPSNREVAGHTGRPQTFALLGDAGPSRGLERWGYRAVHLIQPHVRLVDESAPYLPMLYDLLHVPELRTLVGDADVIDLQWPEQAKLAEILRRLNPTARIVSTFHDVVTQRYRRVGATAKGAARRRSRRQAQLQGKLEPRAANHSDVSVVFSDKDATLLRELGARGEIEIVEPPLACGAGGPWTPPAEPRVTFVSYLAREENHDAALWLVREIWPRVLSRRPDAQLRLVGAGARAELLEAAAAVSAELAGFVDDLVDEYASAAVVVVPLRTGAGVKFKVIEGLVAGVPVVTTSVGAEGIGGAELFAGLTDDPEEFAAAVASALAEPDVMKCERVRAWAEDRFGRGRFEKSVKRIYLRKAEGDPPKTGGAARPTVSVIVPTHNGGDDLFAQLDRLRAELTDDIEILVVDNNSTDETAARVRALATVEPRVRLVPAHGRPGVSVARNKGMAEARGDKFLFCDCDDFIDPGWVQAHAQALDRVDLAGGRVETRVVNNSRTLSWYGASTQQTQLAVASKYLPYANGGNMGVRRSVVGQIGGFDEWFDRGHEEVDFSWRAQHAGFSIGFVPEAVLHYRLRNTVRSVIRQRFWYASSAAQLDLRYAAEVGKPRLRKNLRWIAFLLGKAPSPRRRDRWMPWLLDLVWALGHTRGLLRYGARLR